MTRGKVLTTGNSSSQLVEEPIDQQVEGQGSTAGASSPDFIFFKSTLSVPSLVSAAGCWPLMWMLSETGVTLHTVFGSKRLM